MLNIDKYNGVASIWCDRFLLYNNKETVCPDFCFLDGLIRQKAWFDGKTLCLYGWVSLWSIHLQFFYTQVNVGWLWTVKISFFIVKLDVYEVMLGWSLKKDLCQKFVSTVTLSGLLMVITRTISGLEWVCNKSTVYYSWTKIGWQKECSSE